MSIALEYSSLLRLFVPRLRRGRNWVIFALLLLHWAFLIVCTAAWLKCSQGGKSGPSCVRGKAGKVAQSIQLVQAEVGSYVWWGFQGNAAPDVSFISTTACVCMH